MTIFNLN